MHLANSELLRSTFFHFQLHLVCMHVCAGVCSGGRGEEVEGWGWPTIMLLKNQQMDVKVRRNDATDLLIPQSADMYQLLGLIGV